MSQEFLLKAGYTLNVVTGDSYASVIPVDESSIGMLVTPLHTEIFGPYLIDRKFIVQNAYSVSIEMPFISTYFNGLFMTGSGAPVSATQATLNINPAGNDNAINVTAVRYGSFGNKITVEYLNPNANDATLSVSIAKNRDISVSLATNSGGSITSTAAQIIAALSADQQISRLVTATVDTTDSGTADDGSGVVTAFARTSLSTGDGTGVDVALPGSLYIDITNGFVYRNAGTKAAPSWNKLADV